MEKLEPGQPSRFHVLKHRDGEYRWVLNQQHSQLKSTAICRIDNTEHCAYCGARARPIQARLGSLEAADDPHDPWRYEVTGHTCDCKGARAERKYQDEAAELERKAAERRRALKNRYAKRLKVDYGKLLEMKHEAEKKRVSSGWFTGVCLPIDNHPFHQTSC